MLIFHNDGLIDLDAVRTMGVSVKNEGSFGRFGTGIKYGIATILRGGGTIRLHRGNDFHVFSARKKTIRGQEFMLACLDNKSMGFTTSLGRDWQPWMVLREFGCNARDEGGDFCATREGLGLDSFTGADRTVFEVEWEELETAYSGKADLFIEGEPMFANTDLRILPGSSAHLFYRGVRVFKLEKPSHFRYDILAEQSLTEDRSLVGDYTAKALIRDTLLAMDDKAILGEALLAGGNYLEGQIDFTGGYNTPKASRAFLDVTIEAREAGSNNLSDSARKVLQKHMRETRAREFSGGGAYYRSHNDRFSYAIDALDELGVKFEEDQQFVTVDELPGNAMSMLEGGRVYVHEELLKRSAHDIALELFKRWIDLKGLYTVDAAASLLGPILLARHAGMARVLRLSKEDEAVIQGAEVEPSKPTEAEAEPVA